MKTRVTIITIILSILLTTNVFAGTTYDDYYVLAHALNGECGANWCSDEMIYYAGSVILNRVDDVDYPNSIRDVVFQKGQYQCTRNGLYDKEPSERCWKIAAELLENGSKLPQYVIYQAEFEQGQGMYCKVQNMYFCTKKGTK